MNRTRWASHVTRCAALSGADGAARRPYLTNTVVGTSRRDVPARVRAGGTNHARRADLAPRCAATSRRGRRGAPSLPVGLRSPVLPIPRNALKLRIAANLVTRPTHEIPRSPTPRGQFPLPAERGEGQGEGGLGNT